MITGRIFTSHTFVVPIAPKGHLPLEQLRGAAAQRLRSASRLRAMGGIADTVRHADEVSDPRGHAYPITPAAALRPQIDAFA
jgi:hypothetical protein